MRTMMRTTATTTTTATATTTAMTTTTARKAVGRIPLLHPPRPLHLSLPLPLRRLRRLHAPPTAACIFLCILSAGQPPPADPRETRKGERPGGNVGRSSRNAAPPPSPGPSSPRWREPGAWYRTSASYQQPISSTKRFCGFFLSRPDTTVAAVLQLDISYVPIAIVLSCY